jgi:hypothetical protein
MMWKAVLAGTSALVIAGSTLVYAQQRGPRPESFRRGPPNAEEMQAFANARLAALRAGLSLTPEQQANWPAFEEAARELQKLRLDRMHAMIEQRRSPQPQSTDPAERMRSRGAAMADMGAALKKLADAVDPLYKSLDDNQKRRFAALSRLGDPREAFARGGRDDDRRDGRGDRDFGRGREFRGERDGRDFRDGPDARLGAATHGHRAREGAAAVRTAARRPLEGATRALGLPRASVRADGPRPRDRRRRPRRLTTVGCRS